MGLIYRIKNIQKRITKVTLLVSFFCLYTHTSVKAQDPQFGVKAGLNYSSIIGDLTQGIKFRFSGHAGVFLEVPMTDKFSIQPEIVYSSQGFQFSSDLNAIQNNDPVIDQNDFRTNVQFNYLSVPIIGKFGLSDRIDVEFGPQFAFLLNQVTKIKDLDQRDGTTPENRTSFSGNFQLDYGAVVGFGIQLNEAFSVSPRFYFGLRNRLEGLEGSLQNYNVAVQLSANYQL